MTKQLEILVCNPPNQIYNVHTGKVETTDKNLLMPPIDILTHAAIMREQGHNVTFYDMDANNHNKNDFLSKIREHKPDVIYSLFDEVVQLHSHKAVLNALDLLKTGKEYGAYTIISGIIPSFFYKDILKNDCVDLVIRSEAAPVLKSIFSDDLKNSKKVSGVAYIEGNEIRDNPKIGPFSIDDFWVMPAFDLAEQEKYPIEVRALASSRGCRPAGKGCRFCPYSNFWGRYQAYSAKHTVDEIEELVKGYGYHKIMFIEHNFTLNEKRVKDIVNEINKRKLEFSWGALSRVDISLDILDYMKDAGLKWIHFGAESGDDDTLRKLRKAITADTTRRTIEYAKKIGLRVRSSWIIDAGDTEDSIDKTINLIDELHTDEIKPHFLSYRVFSDLVEDKKIKLDNQSIFCPDSENDRPDDIKIFAKKRFNELCDKLEAEGYAVTREEKAKEGFWENVVLKGKKFVALGPGRYGVGWA